MCAGLTVPLPRPRDPKVRQAFLGRHRDSKRVAERYKESSCLSSWLITSHIPKWRMVCAHFLFCFFLVSPPVRCSQWACSGNVCFNDQGLAELYSGLFRNKSHRDPSPTQLFLFCVGGLQHSLVEVPFCWHSPSIAECKFHWVWVAQ